MIGSNAPTIFDVLQAHPPKVSSDFLWHHRFQVPMASVGDGGWKLDCSILMELSLLLRVPRVDLSHLLRSPNNTRITGSLGQF